MRIIAVACLAILLVLAGVVIYGKAKPDERVKVVPWGPERDGVRIRLVSLGGGFRVGKPMPFRLEMKNATDRVLNYDSQGVGHYDCFEVKNGEGAETPYVGGSPQTVGGARPLEPGEIVELLGNFNVTDNYLVNQAGIYRVKFRGLGPAFGNVGFPESNVVEVKVGKGKLSPVRKVAARLVDILPDDRWEVSCYGTEIYLHCNRTGLKKDVYSISLLMVKEKLSEEASSEYEYVGETTGRFVYLSGSPGGDEIDKEWDGHRKAILAAVEVATK